MKKLIPLLLWFTVPVFGQDLFTQFDAMIQEKYKAGEPGASRSNSSSMKRAIMIRSFSFRAADAREKEKVTDLIAVVTIN